MYFSLCSINILPGILNPPCWYCSFAFGFFDLWRMKINNLLLLNKCNLTMRNNFLGPYNLKRSTCILKNKGSKRLFFTQVFKRRFQAVLKIIMFSWCKEHFNDLKKLFPLKNLLSSGKVLWMLKVLHGTADSNKELSFLESQISAIFFIFQLFKCGSSWVPVAV